jgi:predicted nucleotidyltransferase
MLERRSEALAQVCEKYSVRRLALFGSALAPSFDPDTSDLDFLVEFRDIPPVRRAECFFGLEEDLERLFGSRIDVVEASAVKNPYVQEAIERKQAVLFEVG